MALRPRADRVLAKIHEELPPSCTLLGALIFDGPKAVYQQSNDPPVATEAEYRSCIEW